MKSIHIIAGTVLSLAPMPVAALDRVPPPQAFAAFCDARPRLCETSTTFASFMILDERRRDQLAQVNRLVNSGVAAVTDRDQFGEEDVWTKPSGRGDCEDIAIAKQEILRMFGWPSSVLLLTVVKNRAGEGHTVLMVMTDRGVFVLDSASSAIRTVRETNYTYFMRQSQDDPKVWVDPWKPKDGS